MHGPRGGQLERGPSTSGVPPSRGGASKASEHGVAACHLCGQLEREAHGLPFTDWLARYLPASGEGWRLAQIPPEWKAHRGDRVDA